MKPKSFHLGGMTATTEFTIQRSMQAECYIVGIAVTLRLTSIQHHSAFNKTKKIDFLHCLGRLTGKVGA